jgi:hypothetical protein
VVFGIILGGVVILWFALSVVRPVGFSKRCQGSAAVFEGLSGVFERGFEYHNSHVEQE